jgi:hypothetical protein
VPIPVFLEEISRQDALGTTIPVSVDLHTASPVLSALLAFREKAGQSQDGFVFTSMDSLPLGRAASVAILPSAVFYERLSLAARWASSIQ